MRVELDLGLDIQVVFLGETISPTSDKSISTALHIQQYRATIHLAQRDECASPARAGIKESQARLHRGFKETMSCPIADSAVHRATISTPRRERSPCVKTSSPPEGCSLTRLSECTRYHAYFREIILELLPIYYFRSRFTVVLSKSGEAIAKWATEQVDLALLERPKGLVGLT